MGLPEYLQSNQPPRPLVGWMLQKLNLNPLDENDPALWFAVTCAAAFCSWLKVDGGTTWLFGINGVRRNTPGPWDIFTIQDESTGRRRSLDSDIIFSWERTRPLKITGPVVGAATVIRYAMKQFDIAIPSDVVPLLEVDERTSKDEFQKKLSLLASLVLGRWFAEDAGRQWALETQAILRAVESLQELVYSQHLVPIGTAGTVQHTRKAATEHCEECSLHEPCVKEERPGMLCRRCAGYFQNLGGGDPHAVCRQCDITDCPHWKEFFGTAEKQEWLLSASVR